MKKYRDRKEASEYLYQKWGVKNSPHTLQKKATIGGGPKYVIIAGRAMMTDEWLDEYAESQISTPRRHTSEREAV